MTDQGRGGRISVDLRAYAPEPEVLALAPAQRSRTLVGMLRQHDRKIHVEALAAPGESPLPSGWGIVSDALLMPTVIDLLDADAFFVAMLLSDLQRVQRREVAFAPLLAVRPEDLVAQRLIMSSTALCSVVSLEMAWLVFATGLLPEKLTAEARPWIGLPPPPPPYLPQADVVSLLAALSRAPTVAVAAQWCHLARATAYRLLTRACEAIGVLPPNSRRPDAWAAALLEGLRR